jgi:hypothetical protein
MILLARIAASANPEFTPSPAIGCIEWAASPIKAIRCEMYLSDCKVLKGKAKGLFKIDSILILYYPILDSNYFFKTSLSNLIR